MRWLTLLLIGGLVLAVSGPAWGISFLQPYNGPVTMKFSNWDTGVLYNVSDNQTPVVGEGALNLLPQIPPPNNFGSEDSWGAAQLVWIKGAQNQVLWIAGPGVPEVTGLFWGERDTYLKQTTTISLGLDGQPGKAGVDDDGNLVIDDVSELGWLGSDDIAVAQHIHGVGTHIAF